MHVSKMSLWTRKVLPSVTISLAAIVLSGGTSFAQMSEITAYDRAVTSQTKEAALAFLNEFRSSHLVSDLIGSLRPEVARAVCADLPSGLSVARDACERLRAAPVAEAASGSGEVAAEKAVAAPTQPIQTQPIGNMQSAEVATDVAAAPQRATTASGDQSAASTAATATGEGSMTGPTTPTNAAMGSAVSSGVPELSATAPATPITSRPTVYVRPDAAADILAQAVEGSVIVGTVPGNTPLTVVARDRNWLKVLVPGAAGQVGWVHTSGLQSDARAIKVGPPLGTTAVPPTTAGATKASAIQVASKTVPDVVSGTMTDEAMMSSGIGEIPMPSAGAPSALPAASRAVTPSIPAAQSAATSGYRILLLSTKSAADTQEGWRQLQAVYPDLLVGLQFEVVEVDLGASKGVWYRGLVGPIPDRDEAIVFCAVMRSRPPPNDCSVAGR